MKPGKRLLLLCCLAGFSAQAQYYNKTYHSDKPNHVQDLVTAYVQGYSMMLSRFHPDSMADNKVIILTKFDANGNVLFERKWSLSDELNEIITPDRLVFTPDNGYIVVGYIRKIAEGTLNPFAARFDVNGNKVWAKEYDGQNTDWFDPGRFPSASIDRTDYDEYIIVANSKPYWYNNYTYYPQDASIHAFKIDGSGTQIWNNKYELVNGGGLNERGTLPGSVYHHLTNMPRTVVNCDNRQYFIAGTVDNGPGGGLAYNNFYMSLNPDGSVAEKYKLNRSAYHPMSEKAVWNPNDGTVSLSYTTGNAGLVSPSPMRTVSEIMALVRFRLTGSGLIPFSGPTPLADYYYDDKAQSSNVIGHCLTALRDRYVFSCWLSSSEVSGPGIKNHMALMDIDMATMNPVNANRFNVLRSSQPTTSPVYLSDPPGSARRYAMAGNINYNVPGNKDTRVISANNIMDACGADPLLMWHDGGLIDVQELNYLRNPIPRASEELDITELEYETTSTNCLQAIDEATYKTSAAAAGETTRPQVFPSLLGAGEDRLNISLYTEAATDLELSVSSIDGKVLLRRSLQTVPGQQTLYTELTELCPGNYIVRLVSNDQKIILNTKLTRM